MRPVTLYIKTHTATGIKYFGRTVSDPYSYSGSGTQWKKILRDLGADHTTEVYGVYSSPEELENAARQFSEDFDIVKSEEWANLKIENGLHPERTGGVFIDDSRSRIKRRDLHSGLIRKLPTGFFTVMTDEEREGTLLGFNPVWQINLSDSLPQLRSVFTLAMTPGKIEPESEKNFAQHLLERYGMLFTDEMFDRIIAAFPPMDIYDRTLSLTVDRQRIAAKRIRKG